MLGACDRDGPGLMVAAVIWFSARSGERTPVFPPGVPLCADCSQFGRSTCHAIA